MRIVACGDTLFSSTNLAGRLGPRLIGILKDADGTFANAEFSCPKSRSRRAHCRPFRSLELTAIATVVAAMSV